MTMLLAVGGLIGVLAVGVALMLYHDRRQERSRHL